MNHSKIRIAKLLANYNYGSRREIEKLIFEKKIILNNNLVNSPATFANETDKICDEFTEKCDEINKGMEECEVNKHVSKKRVKKT